jgi:hypothetical protein
MTTPAGQPLPEADFSTMMMNAIQGCMNAQVTLQKLSGEVMGAGNGKSTVLQIPGQRPVVLNGPDPHMLQAASMQSLALALQGIRILLVAINDLDSRLRALDTRPSTSPSSGT